MAQHRTITQDAFAVAPQLLGLPLARPGRRAIAMLIDLVLVSILIKLGGALFGFAAAFVLWRVSGRGAGGGMVRKSARLAFRLGAAIVGFAVIVSLWDNLTEDEESDAGAEQVQQSGFDFDTGNLDISGDDGLKLIRWGLALRTTSDSARASSLADSLAALFRRSGANNEDLAELRAGIHDAVDSNDKPAVRLAIDRAFGLTSTTIHPPALAAQLAEAAERNDSSAVDSLQRELRTVLAGSDLTQLRRRAEQQARRINSLEDELERKRRGPSARTVIAGFADDLGLGFGWMALYFTAFLALMRGQTPGKKVMGLRVLRLDARPITWFIAFERFGGYAASATLGLLGFLQILWDRNRQGLHDKAVETVVVIDQPMLAAAAPPPAHSSPRPPR